MNIFYKCKCLKEEVEVTVPNRHADQDVVDWMQRVAMMSIGADHAARSPFCRATEMEYAKIPLDDEERGIGYPAGKPN